MKRHSVSHAIGALICTISSVGISQLLKDFLPDVHSMLLVVANFLKKLIPYKISEEVLGYAILASILMFFWGIGFYLMHEREKG